MIIGIPVVLLLLFVYVFGGTLGAGLDAVTGGREAYVNYVTPGIILVTVAGVAQGTALAVSMDMADGIIARFRTMGIARGSVLTGHVLGSTLQTLLGMVAVIGVAVAIGFRPNAGPGEWVAAAGLLAMVTVAITWLSVALGLHAKSVEAASNVTLPLMLLVFIGSGFVPTDSMPAGLRGVRRVPAVHADHRDASRAADGHADRAQRGVGGRLVRRDRVLRLLVGDAALRPRSHAPGPGAQRRRRMRPVSPSDGTLRTVAGCASGNTRG